jgi:integrase
MKWPMLTRRGVTYYHRQVVPVALRPLLENRREIWKSLRTTDLEEAKLLSLRAGREVARLFQSLKKKAAAAQTDPDTFGRDFERRALAEDAQWRATRGQVADEQLEAELDGIIQSIENNEESLRLGDTKYVSKLLDEVLLEQGLHVPPSQRQAFAHALLRSRLDMLKVTAKRTRGEWDGEPPQNQGITVEGLLNAYLGERKLSTKTEAEVRAGYRRFASIVGPFKLVADVTKQDARAYKESLLAAPSNRALSRDGKLSAVSVRKLLGIVAGVFRYGVSQGHLESSPFQGLTVVTRGNGVADLRRLPYDATDLRKIFGSEAYRELTGAKRWIPLIALYSGGRLEEVAGLRVKDIRAEAGVTFFAFEPHSERGLKTDSSRRNVPVHPELITLGLLDYAKTVPQDGLLFPSLRPGPHGKRSGAFSKWYARFVDGLGVSDPRKAFHSFRHSFKDACRAAGISEEIHDALTGHVSGGGVGRKYGLGPSLPVMAEAIARIEYRGVLSWSGSL